MYYIFEKILTFAFKINTAFAQGGGGAPGGGGGGSPSNIITTTLPNPVQANNIPQLLDRLMNFAFTIAIPIAAIMIFWGAFQIMTAGGTPANLDKGKKTILWTLVGFSILLIAKGITSIIREILGV